MPTARSGIFDSTWSLRVLAFLMACSLWLFVGLGAQQETAKRKVELNIELRNPPPGSRWRPDPGTAEAVLEGPARKLERLDVASLHAFADVDAVHPTRNLATVSIATPEGVKLDQVVPPQVRLKEGEAPRKTSETILAPGH